MVRIGTVMLLLWVGFLAGCSALGNIVIGHHPNSLVETSGEPRVELRKHGAAIAAIGTVVIGKAVEIAVDQLQRAIEKESKRYKATYSARDSAFFYTFDNQQLVQEFDEIFFERKYKGQSGDETALSFSAGVEVTPDGAALRIFPKEFRLNKTKSKVAFPSPYPWHWIASALWGPWFLADGSIADVDVSIQISIDAIGVDKNGKTVSVAVGALDFPMGKARISSLPKIKSNLASLNTGYLPLPKIDSSVRSGLPVNVTVTAIEANDLGDVIAQGAEKLKKEKESVVKRVLETLGIE